MIDTLPVTSKLEQHRQEFPGLANKVYFNFGGQGTLPRSSLEAIIDAHNYLQQQGPFSLRINNWIKQKNALIRQALADELGAPIETITLTENVTVGCNIVLWGIEWQKGDRILITDCEHPGIIKIVQEIAKRFDVQVSICPISTTLNGGDPATLIAQHLQPNTRLVVLSHVLWNTGQVLPLAEIVEVCHNYSPGNYPVQILVDAAQSVGALPLNLTELNADFYAFTGHKWLCGPVGVGGLYVHPEVFESLRPTFIGWRGIDLDEAGNPSNWKNDGQRFEVATSAYPQYEGLRAAITIHQEWGTSEERYQRIRELSEYLWRGLSEVNNVQCLKISPPEAGLVSFQVTNNLSHEYLVQALEKQGFFLRKIASPDCVRACVHYLTLPAEIEHLVEAIENLSNSD